MKRYIAICLTALFMSAAFVAYPQTASFNVATYNIRQQNGSDTDKGNGWKRRCPHIAELVRFHDFHIFGTQEGFMNQLEDLKNLLPGYEYTGVGREDGKHKGEHSAIFYDTNVFELLDHGDFWLSETPDRPSVGWDAVLPRICSWGRFRHKASGKEFQFFNLHLDHVGKQARVESVKLVQRKMKELGLGLPTFLTGDFNVDQTHGSYRELATSGFLSDSFGVADFVYAPNGTFNDYHTDGFTESRIDHIFVSDGVKVEKYGVLTDTYRTPRVKGKKGKDSAEDVTMSEYECRVPSDHFPVKIKISLDSSDIPEEDSGPEK